MEPQQNNTERFVPTTAFNTLMVLQLVVVVYICFLAIGSSPTAILEISMVQISAEGLILLLGYPMSSRLFGVSLNRFEISGLNKPTWMFGRRTSCQWKNIQTVELQNFFALQFIVLINRHQQRLLYIPVNLKNFNQLVELIKNLAPENSPLVQFFKLTPRRKKWGWFYRMVGNYVPIRINGKVVRAGDLPLPHAKIRIYHHNVLVSEVICDRKGVIRHKLQYFPGRYLFKIKTRGWMGEGEVDLPLPVGHTIKIEAKQDRIT